MSTFFSLWFLAAASGLVAKGVTVLRRRRSARAELRRLAAEEERARPAREAAEREAEQRREREAAQARRREDARAACELLYALHAPEIATRLPKATFEQFLTKLLREDLPPEVVERKAEEIRELVRSHTEHARGGKKPEAVADVQAWYAAQLAQLSSVGDVRLRESFEALLLQQFHERMLRAMGDEG